jgi:galactokinase/mevalonate kinase-like predicted kinase
MIFTVDAVKKPDLIKALDRFKGRVVNFHFSENGCKSWKIN